VNTEDLLCLGFVGELMDGVLNEMQRNQFESSFLPLPQHEGQKFMNQANYNLTKILYGLLD